MATGYGDRRDDNDGFRSAKSRNNSSRDYSPSRADGFHKQTTNTSYSQQHSIDPEQMTLEVVRNFKLIVQEKIRQNNQLSEPIIELAIAKIRTERYPDQCSFAQCKRELRDDIENCPDSILRVSLAYGNTVDEIKPIIKTKMNSINAPDVSLNNIMGPLKNLKAELDNTRQFNLLRSVRNINDENRATRLFYSEARHFAPGVKEYTFTDANNAVQAIRETTSESVEPGDLIPIIKTFREVEEIREHLEKCSAPPKCPIQPPIKTTRFTEDERTSSNSTSFNDSSSYLYKPLPDPYKTPSAFSRQTDNSSKDDQTRSTSRRFTQDNN